MKPTLLILFSLMLSEAIHASEPATKEERNKAIAQRVFDEIFNEGRFSVADEIYAPDFKNHGFSRDVDLKVDQDYVHAEKKAFPDLKITVNHMVGEGDLVAVHWTFRGTHTHDGYGGLPATGTRVSMRGMTIWRIVDGKITEEWSSFDEMGAYAQVIGHVKWYLVAAFVAFLIVVVITERLLCWLIRAAFRKSFRANRSRS